MKRLLLFLFVFSLTACGTNPWKEKPSEASYDALLSGYQYPFEVRFKSFQVQRQLVQMAFMDVPAAKPDAPVIVLLHGKNFGGYAFAKVAARLNEMGYRVFIPDQVGFGKSSKPMNFQYSFHALAKLTDALLESQGVTQYTVLGHSMGGMLATRMALMYPKKINKLVLVNPIGLEDYKTLTPYRSVEEAYQEELRATPDTIKQYQQSAYYAGEWKAEYDELIIPASGWTRHPDYPLVAWNAALTFDMLYTQPVLYEFKEIKVPTAIIIGLRDKTAPGRAWASEDNKEKMGNYPKLGRLTSKAIPRSKLYELKGVGHIPFAENMDQFFKEGLIPALKK